MQWNPAFLNEVSSEKVDRVFQPFEAELELNIPPEGDAYRSFFVKIKN